MDNLAHYFDSFFFIAMPYVAFFTFFLVTIERYRRRKFTYSSLSSQFLENKQHFWGLVPFHYGIIAVIIGHIVAFCVPREILWWNSKPLRLYILEASALIFAILAVVGLAAAMIRRFNVPKVRVVTTKMDWLILALLMLQLLTGIDVAVRYPWGSSWFAASAAPYLWSIAKLDPNISYIVAMPFTVKLHIINAYLLILLFPFSRLVHILVMPNPYLWRKTQVARWYRKPRNA